MTITLTPAQHAVLAYAIHHNAGKIDWFPATIKGGARQKVLEGLATRGLADSVGADWLVSDTGYHAMGCAPVQPDVLATATAAPEATIGEPVPPTTRAHSKQATVIAMLKRPEGATINEIMAVTGWLAHTVRGTFAGALKKKLGLTVTSDKPQGSQRVYRLE